MTLQSKWLPVDGVVELLPLEHLAVVSQVDVVEVGEDSLVGVIATVDVHPGIEEGGGVVGATGDVLAVDFELAPAGVEGRLQVGFDHQVAVFALRFLVFARHKV